MPRRDMEPTISTLVQMLSRSTSESGTGPAVVGGGGGYSAGYGSNMTATAGVPNLSVHADRASKDDTRNRIILGSVFGGVAALAAIYLTVCCGGWAFRAAWREAWARRPTRPRGTRTKAKDVEAQAVTSEHVPTVVPCSYLERQRSSYPGDDAAGPTAEVAAAWPGPSTATRP